MSSLVKQLLFPISALLVLVIFIAVGKIRKALKGKKKNEDEVVEKKVQTAQDFVNVREIKNGIIFTKNNEIFTVLGISPLATDMLSKREQKILTEIITANMSSENKMWSLLSISRPIDLTNIIMEHSVRLKKQNNVICRQLIREDIETMNAIAMSGGVVEFKHYIIIGSVYTENNLSELRKRASDITRNFLTDKTSCKILSEYEIKQLINLINNPQDKNANLDESNIPIIEGR